ncbi:class I SAM-dependent methyltransferase [Infirmifilum lucidum]|uniref:Class I SAM-dependent methyltransferase n=1 Tax=Infirmifilum lucidum TaxID=2776706 RepID=A0A7L9FIJ3_9CREN|nr:class I SAM-dependent methyltransferase [Infirmifilum lucidum]QOJ79658.1 class I SAM-dependent methyltransferase [Infirmifilum lucidum]
MLPYDKIAGVYDSVYGVEQTRKNIVAATLLDGARSLVDIGCGTGILGTLLHETEYYVCLDLSLGMLKVFRRKEMACPSDAVRADAALLPFRDGSFDGVACITVIHEAPRALSEITRVVKSGGKVVLSLKKRFKVSLNLTCLEVEKVLESGGDEILLLRAATPSDAEPTRIRGPEEREPNEER